MLKGHLTRVIYHQVCEEYVVPFSLGSRPGRRESWRSCIHASPRSTSAAGNIPPASVAFRVSGFGFRVSGFRFQVSGFGFRVSGFGFRGSGFRFRVSGFGRTHPLPRAKTHMRARYLGLRAVDLGFGAPCPQSTSTAGSTLFAHVGVRVTNFGFRVPGFRLVSGFGLWVSSFGG